MGQRMRVQYSPIPPQKSPTPPQKSPVYLQKSPKPPHTSPTSPQKARFMCKRALYLLCLSMYIDGVCSRDVQRCDDECALHVNASSYYYRRESYIGQRVRSSWNLLLQRYIFTYTYIYIYVCSMCKSMLF